MIVTDPIPLPDRRGANSGTVARAYPPSTFAANRNVVVRGFRHSLRQPSLSPTVRVTEMVRPPAYVTGLPGVFFRMMARLTPTLEDVIHVEITAAGDVMRPTVRARPSDVDVLLRRLLSAPPTLVERLASVPEDDLDDELWGPKPSPAEVRSALSWHVREGITRRKQVLDGSLDVDEVASLLGTKPAAVSSEVAAGRVVALIDGGVLRFPLWQFEPTGKTAVLPFQSVLDAFRGGPVEFSLWAERPSVDLGGKTPREVLAEGDVEAVTQAAEAIGPSAW